ncbi:MAG: hypothetical protein GY696_06260, partial [Gammaproteobacteria bacterium]|nr:hypothetical protein [Gammaproteobacteria bacterium]
MLTLIGDDEEIFRLRFSTHTDMLFRKLSYGTMDQLLQKYGKGVKTDIIVFRDALAETVARKQMIFGSNAK